MAQPQHTPSLDCLEEAVTVLFCFIDDAYALLNPRARRYESLKQLSDSEIIALTLLQQLRGVESGRSFCVRPNGSSRTCFRGWQGFTLPRSTGR
jgi:hypothetical protein